MSTESRNSPLLVVRKPRWGHSGLGVAVDQAGFPVLGSRSAHWQAPSSMTKAERASAGISVASPAASSEGVSALGMAAGSEEAAGGGAVERGVQAKASSEAEAMKRRFCMGDNRRRSLKLDLQQVRIPKDPAQVRIIPDLGEPVHGSAKRSICGEASDAVLTGALRSTRTGPGSDKSKALRIGVKSFHFIVNIGDLWGSKITILKY